MERRLHLRADGVLRLHLTEKHRMMTYRKLLSADILLFDMDGTLLDAAPVIERIQATWAGRNDINVSRLLAASRGQRVAETVRAFAPPGTDVLAQERWLSRQAHVEAIGARLKD